MMSFRALLCAAVLTTAGSSALAERLPTTEEISRIQAEQPMPGIETLEAVRGKNADDTARAMSQAQQQSRQSNDTGGAPASGLPAVDGRAEGVDVQALVEKHYSANRQTFAGGGKKATPGLLYFASLTVPAASLDRIIDQAAKSGAALVLRGLVKGGDLRATAERLGALLKGREVSILIDPTLFARFDVRHAPTIVLIAGEPPRCEDQACSAPTPPYWSVAGDVSLDYALEAIARQAPEASSVAQPYLAALRGGFHENR